MGTALNLTEVAAQSQYATDQLEELRALRRDAERYRWVKCVRPGALLAVAGPVERGVMPVAEALHVAVCQAVALLNRAPEVARCAEGREARDLLRQVLVDYAEVDRRKAEKKARKLAR